MSTAHHRRLTISGGSGRMGLAIARLAPEHGFSLVSALVGPDDAGFRCGPAVAVTDPFQAVRDTDIVIDFSHATAVARLSEACAEKRVPLVCGTTNLDQAGRDALDRLAEVAPVLWSPNMSFGVQLLADLVEQAVRRLGPSYDAEVVEIHHNRKVDSPSGTAKRLVEAIRVGSESEERLVHGREGEVGARRTGEIGVHAVRGGDVIGDHTVLLLGQAERIELTHRATSRDLFAHGALRAASFLVGKPAGRYTIRDILGE